MGGSTGAMLALTGVNVGNPAIEYMTILKSNRVIDPVIKKLDNEDATDDKFTAEDFVKKYMKVDNTRGTSLVSIQITAGSPSEAQQIAQDVTTSFQKALVDMSGTQDSAMVKLLDDKIKVAKDNLDKSREALAKYSQESGVYSPSDQEKILLEQSAGYEKAKSEASVQVSTNSAILSSVESQLDDQNSKAVESKMADNPEIQEIRSKLLAANQTLATLKFKFTDDHPEVIKAQEQVRFLNDELNKTVTAAVDSESTTLNSAQGELIKKRMVADANLDAAKASISTLDQLSSDGKTSTNELSQKSIKYFELAQNQKIAEDTYKLLVKSSEELKIKENLSNFDIKIVDAPSLPVKHSWPRKLYVVLTGFVVYLFGVGIYLYIQYRRKIG